MFHVMTGARNRSAVWAAQRVPDDSVVAAPNSFIIRQMDLSDKDNFMASPNVKSFAKEMGWWNPRRDGEFDFAAAYAVSDPLPLVPLYIGRRMWRIYTMLAPNLKLNPDLGYLPIFKHRTYPFSIVPVEKLYPQDFMRIMRDHYEGTPFDMTKGLAAGPFGNPTRWIGDKSVSGAWERSISVFRASYSFVAVSRPRSPIPAILWYGHDAPHGTVYVPFFSGQTSVPESYLSSKQSVFDPTGAWWAFNFINNWCQLAFNVMQPEVWWCGWQAARDGCHQEATQIAIQIPQLFGGIRLIPGGGARAHTHTCARMFLGHGQCLLALLCPYQLPKCLEIGLPWT